MSDFNGALWDFVIDWGGPVGALVWVAILLLAAEAYKDVPPSNDGYLYIPPTL